MAAYANEVISKETTKDKNYIFNPLSANPTKWPNTLKQFVAKLPTNCLSVFGHFVNLALKVLIISPNPRNRNLLQCKCKTNVWHLICEHALAAALNLGITFDYLVEVKKKILTSRKSKGFTKAVNKNPSIKEKGLKKSQIQNKCNEGVKPATSKR